MQTFPPGEMGVLEPRLAAVFSSGAGGGGEKMNSGVLTRRRQQTSPHTLMGAASSALFITHLLNFDRESFGNPLLQFSFQV